MIGSCRYMPWPGVLCHSLLASSGSKDALCKLQIVTCPHLLSVIKLRSPIRDLEVAHCKSDFAQNMNRGFWSSLRPATLVLVAEALLLEAVTPTGRHRQLDNLRGWVADLSSGRGRVALIEGEPGIGKSSLVHAAASEAELHGCQLFWATCDELSQAFPLLPLLDALDGRASEERAGQRRIAEMLRAEPAPGDRVDVVAAAAERLLALVDHLCALAPTMLVVDDLQWADPATVMTLGRLARAVHQVPLLLVCINRPVPRR